MTIDARSPEPGRPLYLCAGAQPSMAFHHAPGGPPRRTAVLLCPPFGWDDVCAYRSLREWAIELAGDGRHALRVQLPGTADSAGSPWDSDRLDAWTGAVAGAAAWLRARNGVERVCAIGIGLGGLLAAAAAAGGSAIDDLVLWGSPARGRTLLRELRAFARLEESKWSYPGAPEPPPTPHGAFEVAGFVLSAPTMEALEAVDLTGSELPYAGQRRALLLGRSGLPPDSRLRAWLEAAGVAVDSAEGDGYGEMMAGAQESRPPREVFAHVRAWLDEGDGPASPVIAPPPPEGRDCLHLGAVDDASAAVRETPLALELPSGRVFGILAQPAGPADPAPITAVLLNAGAIRRIGPNRMWVEAARRWAARGVPTLRLDLEGIGDAPGPADRYTELAQLYVPELVAQVAETLDGLAERGLPPRFALGGLCSGAYWAFQAALADPRVAAALLLNPRALYWDPELEIRRAQRRLGEIAASPALWRRFATHQNRRRLARHALRGVRALPSRLVRRNGGGMFGHDELPGALDRLRDSGRSVLMAFSDREPLDEEMRAAGLLDHPERWPNLRLQTLPGNIHTLRPLHAQRAAHAALDAALRAEVDRAPSVEAGRAALRR